MKWWFRFIFSNCRHGVHFNWYRAGLEHYCKYFYLHTTPPLPSIWLCFIAHLELRMNDLSHVTRWYVARPRSHSTSSIHTTIFMFKFNPTYLLFYSTHQKPHTLVQSFPFLFSSLNLISCLSPAACLLKIEGARLKRNASIKIQISHITGSL